MSKPIANVTCLATGPTHYLRLPVAGPTPLIPGSSMLVYDKADLAEIERVVPASQLKIRVFPRIEDAPAQAVQPASSVGRNLPPKGNRRK